MPYIMQLVDCEIIFLPSLRIVLDQGAFLLYELITAPMGDCRMLFLLEANYPHPLLIV